MLTILALGFLIGIRHAFEPDHVAAVASLATRATSLKQAARQGAAWGLGHTITLFIVCTVVMALDTAISERVAGYLEAAVGVMLMALGLDVLRRLWRDRVHFHAHSHAGGITHFHAHSHKGEAAAAHNDKRHDHDHEQARQFPFRALAVGLMQGMAGSAALIVLAAQAVQSVWLGLAYVALFGVGSIVGMAVFSAVICVPMKNAKTLTWAHNGLQLAVGVGTALLGASTVYQHLVA
jgi:ABC-type nickel/cobalt efflux system permease component RcnA